MLDITVTNVGQGDTLILEWLNSSKKKEIGIIDCHLKNNSQNKAIEYISAKKYKSIRFLILSHPHTDHFSGYLSLLDFCEERNIKIREFIHSAIYNKEYIDVQTYLQSFVNRKKDLNKLKRTFKTIDKLYKKKLIKHIAIGSENYKIKLNDKIHMQYLSPTLNDEITNYLSSTFVREGKKLILNIDKKRENNPNANLLSSFIQISCEKWRIMLPSDSTSFTLKRIFDNNTDLEDIDPKKQILILFQIPHHGSKTNHYEGFWNDRISSIKKTTAFLSVGDKYGHPSYEVIQYFKRKCNNVYSTNLTGGLREYQRDYIEFIKSMEQIKMYLEICGIEIENHHTSSDNILGDFKIAIRDNGKCEINKIHDFKNDN